MMIAGGGIGGIIASLAFRQQDAPQYRPGLIVVISLQVVLFSAPKKKELENAMVR